jgi:hypothetical protein
MIKLTKKNFIIFFVVLITIGGLQGCAVTIPKEALILTPETLAARQIQTRKYETNDEAKILSACIEHLQDLGFILAESETKLGVIVATKSRSAVEAGQVVAALVVAVIIGAPVPWEHEQQFTACVVTRPVGENSIIVRVTFQRIVWNTNNMVTKREALMDPIQYQEFFSKLSKSIFLEAHEI